MNILIAVSLFYPHAGGAEYQSLRLAREFVKKGHRVSVVTRSFKGLTPYEEIDGVNVWRTIRVVDCGVLFGITYLITLLFFLLRRWHEFDVILTPQLTLDTVASVATRTFTGTPVVARAACGGSYSDILRLRGMKGGGMLLNYARRVDGMIALSNQILDELARAGFERNRIVSIPNGVDTAEFRPSETGVRQRELLGIPGESFMVFFMGRFDQQKGLTNLLHAWDRACSCIDNGLLVLAGEGEQREELEAIVSELGLTAKVRFTGKISNAGQYLEAANVFVLPSLAEGMSNALLEAMSSGLPCIASRNGSNEELVDHMNTGLLVPVDAPDVLADALIKLSVDCELAVRLGKNARDKVVEKYDLALVAERHLAFYEDILNTKERHA